MSSLPGTAQPAGTAQPTRAAQPSGTPRAEAVVDLGAIRQNVALLSGSARESGAQTMAVVKADGYGHGAVEVGRAALAAGATWLGVCTIEEALELREAGITAPVLSWLHLPDDDFAPAIAADVDLSVSSVRHLAGVLDGARRTGRPARLHLKIDTGLSRNGCQPGDWPELLDAVEKAGDEAEVVAVWSHLAHADQPHHPVIDTQLARLNAAWEQARRRGFAPLRHLANSAATLTRPDLHLDIVRPGIAVYGLDPLDRPVEASPLRPAMEFRARVALVKRVPAGEGVSYGHEWTTPHDTTLALVPVGYADGVPRRLNARGRMRVRLAGEVRPVVGRVCMDQVVVDCGEDEVHEGDTAVLFGAGDGGGPTAQDWATELGTIHYEIATGVHGARVRRTHLGAGE
ncbi:alanine racemase [Pseudonocardia halophobica]|uniref:alanine racemase n=1 Tax=Pseudonocardia halophobica TaxID=29401 RepID=UPI003CD0A243